MTLNERATTPLEVWGGVECTVNRVQDAYFDQTELTGHGDRPEDIDRLAALGLRTLRYPVLWERIAPDGLETADWRWTDERLERMRSLGMQPIAGLLHHGSGPRETSLLDEQLPERLAAFALAVAERYPWVDRYTPVNEPLTTARFSALYGHWYPHATDERSFVRALLNQCRATVLAMRAIRSVNPAAQLVQTEDYGRTLSTPLLAYQADFENARRWLSLDLLCGRIDRGHRLWGWLLERGASKDELDAFVAEPCPPDVIGVNYYMTSERYLDERTDRYPREYAGGNAFHRYADVEAVRVMPHELSGHRRVLGELWERYHLPLAVTEVHLGCSRDEQIRWLLESWQGAQTAVAEGIDVRAITVWAAFGSYDWRTLVTRLEGYYEPGLFDVRADPPRATALASVVRALIEDGVYEHPINAREGWWRRPDRYFYEALADEADAVPDAA